MIRHSAVSGVRSEFIDTTVNLARRHAQRRISRMSRKRVPSGYGQTTDSVFTFLTLPPMTHQEALDAVSSS